MEHIIDAYKSFSIHKDEYEKLSQEQKNFLDAYEDLDFENMLNSSTDRTETTIKAIKEMVDIISSNNNEESNIECIAIDKIVYMLKHLTLQEFRKLHLEKIL
jgi:hypothetical protein